MKHFDEGMVHAWLDGALNDDEAAEMERHAAACAECRARVAEARGLLAAASRILSALDDVPGGVTPVAGTAGRAGTAARAAKRRWLRPTAWAVAAALMLAVGVRSLRESGSGRLGSKTVEQSDSRTAGQDGARTAATPTTRTTPPTAVGGAPDTVARPARPKNQPVTAKAMDAMAARTDRAALDSARLQSQNVVAARVGEPQAAERGAGAPAGMSTVTTTGAVAPAMAVRDAKVRSAAAAPATLAVPTASSESDSIGRRRIVECYELGSARIVLDTVAAAGDFQGWRTLRGDGETIGRWTTIAGDSLVLWMDRPTPRMLRGVMMPPGLRLREAPGGGEIWAGRVGCGRE